MGCCDSQYDRDLAAPNRLLLAVCAVLTDEDGRILIAKRREGKPYAGYWEFPGGKIAEGESPQAALCRELREELAIETCCGCFSPFRFISHPYPEYHVLLPVFLCRQWEGIPVGAEGQEIKWIRPSAHASYRMLHANAELLREL
jgi:8-oxo-dGTP diphosphatase